MQANILKKDQN